MEVWPGHFPLCPFKIGATGGGAFSSSAGTGKFSGCEGFSPNFSKLARKDLCNFYLQIFSQKDHIDLFLV